MQKSPCVYILANDFGSVLYLGVTSNLIQRIWQHRQHLMPGFTSKYNVDSLVWYEQHLEIEQAIVREKQIKKWNRDWKVQLIEKENPEWRDLYLDLVG